MKAKNEALIITRSKMTRFAGKNVTKALGYPNPSKALADHCKDVTKRYTQPAVANESFPSSLNPTFGEIRTVTINDEPWFVGKDVAQVLGYSNPQKAVRDHVDDEDRTVNESFTVNGTAGTLINESGLYSLILSSKLPTAKEFKRWVTSEVLPSIRKHGGYIAGAGKHGL